MSSDDHYRQQKSAHRVFEKISNKISSIKEDITDAIKERTSSISSDRHNSMSSENYSANTNPVVFTLQDDNISLFDEPKQTSKSSLKDADSIGSASSLIPSTSVPVTGTPMYSINQLVLNMGVGCIRPNIINLPSLSTTLSSNSTISAQPSSTGSLSSSEYISSQPIIKSSNSRQNFESTDDTLSNKMSLNEKEEKDEDGGVKKRIIMKIDPLDMTAKPMVITVTKDSARRTAMYLAGPKFELNSSEIPSDELKIDSTTIYTVAIAVGIISLILSLWKPISSYFSGLLVGVLFAAALLYIFLQMFIDRKKEENAITEWVEFPSLEAMLTKCDREDKNTNIQVTGASMAFQCYDADHDDAFVRYPCDLRLDGYRLIIQLASKQWSEEKKGDKDTKFIGYREYLIKDARMILVPEATLTRAKYWMNDYPIVIQDLQILDKQIQNKHLLEKSKLDANDFFTNTATILSIWFDTCLQKEEWFHKLSLVLRKGKEEMQLATNLSGDSSSLTSTSFSSLHRRLPQTDADVELVSNTVTESDINAAITETQQNADELQRKAKIVEPESVDIDASGTRRTVARNSKRTKPNEASLQKVLASQECLDEAAITINLMTRRLLCDMFDVPSFEDLIKTKVELKLREVAVSILENLRVISVDLGNTFPIILKVEPMQWNTQGIWFNLFLYYRGSFKLSVRTRVVLQKLINYDPTKDKPIFPQYHSGKLGRTDEEPIDADDLLQQQKLLAEEPEVPEMFATRKLGLALMKLATNKYFQMIVNIPFVKKLIEKFSEEETGADVEVTSFSGILSINIPPPPSDRLWIGFPEVPDLNIKVIPTYGEKQYVHTLLQDFLLARIRAELKRLVVLPAMDDQLLPFFRDWVIDIISEIASKPINPSTDDNKAKLHAQAAARAESDPYINDSNSKKQPSTKSTSLLSETASF